MSTTAVLLLAPATARDSSAAQLQLRPDINVVRVQWVVPPQVGGNNFLLSVTRNGVALKKVNQHGAVLQIKGSGSAEFLLEASAFHQPAPNPRFLFVVSAFDSPETTIGEYPVSVSKK